MKRPLNSNNGIAIRIPMVANESVIFVLAGADNGTSTRNRLLARMSPTLHLPKVFLSRKAEVCIGDYVPSLISWQASQINNNFR
jgi:hypothetical protein